MARRSVGDKCTEGTEEHTWTVVEITPLGVVILRHDKYGHLMSLESLVEDAPYGITWDDGSKTDSGYRDGQG